MNSPRRHPNTTLLHCGRDSQRFDGLVNVPVCRGSTLLAESFDAWERARQGGNPYAHYGRFGTATTHAFERAINELEGGHGSRVFPSGLSACTHALLAFLSSGDHALFSDSVYGPTRAFAERVLKRLGIAVDYFDPCDPEDLARQLCAKTRLVFVEAPGSLTFEMIDLPRVCAIAHSASAIVVMDNTWATPLGCRPFELGVDVSLHAATKYIVGHSDALLGVATATFDAWERLRDGAQDFGETAGPDDLYLALRGLRTLGVRLERHAANARCLVDQLADHPMIASVHYPASPRDPGYELWQRDFDGASGLFGVRLKTTERDAIERFFDRLELFGIGLSWGGFESLALPVGTPLRSRAQVNGEGYLVRFHAGLEQACDLLADLDQALAALDPRVSVAVRSAVDASAG